MGSTGSWKPGTPGYGFVSSSVGGKNPYDVLNPTYTLLMFCPLSVYSETRPEGQQIKYYSQMHPHASTQVMPTKDWIIDLIYCDLRGHHIPLLERLDHRSYILVYHYMILLMSGRHVHH